MAYYYRTEKGTPLLKAQEPRQRLRVLPSGSIMSTAPKAQQEQFAGCLLYRKNHGSVEVLLVHPTGKSKRWQIPQIAVDADEDLAEAAAQQVRDETGVHAKGLDYLGSVDYAKRKLHCFYGEAKAGDQPQRHHLEINAARFVDLEDAGQILDKRQQQLLRALKSMLMLLREIA